MSKRATFFATRDDLEVLLEQVDMKTEVQFIEAGRFDTISVPIFHCLKAIPDLGIASANSSTRCKRYLVSGQGNKILARELSSSPRFAFDQLVNPDTAIFSPGGLWRCNILITGSIATVSNDPTSLKIANIFRASLKKKFKPIRGNYVGDQAMELLEKGARLPAAENSPVEYDLNIGTSQSKAKI